LLTLAFGVAKGDFPRVEEDDLGGFAEPYGAAIPAFGMALPCRLEGCLSASKNLLGASIVTGGWSHIADGAVPVFFVVPAHKTVDPLAGMLKALKGLARIGGPILQGPKHVLVKTNDIRVVCTCYSR